MLVAFAVALAAAAAATIAGADAARRPFDAFAVSSAAAARALAYGAGDPVARAGLAALRSRLAERPLDVETRVAYASVLEAVAASAEDRRLVAFHARTALRLAPVSVPVVSAAATILARCGAADESRRQVRSMFGYDPSAAARLLRDLEPDLVADRWGEAVPDDPDAWLAWSRALQGMGRVEDAVAALERSRARWPSHLGLLAAAAQRALQQRRWDDLTAMLPPGLEVGDDPAAAAILTFRARSRAHAGDVAGARADVDRALRLGPRQGWIRGQAGESLLEIGDAEGAIGVWRSGVFLAPAPPKGTPTRVSLLTRVAQTQERLGRAGDALRTWKEILEIDPDSAGAKRRVAQMEGP